MIFHLEYTAIMTYYSILIVRRMLHGIITDLAKLQQVRHTSYKFGYKNLFHYLKP